MRLALDRVGHRAGGERELYRDLTLEFEPGGITALIGPNGSGKSTLLRQLVGIETPDQGRVLIDGQPLAQIPRRQRAGWMGYLPQHTPLYYDLRVREVVLLGRAPLLGRFAAPGEEDERAIDSALAQVELAGLAERSVSSLSGGERQRVMLARLLATGTPILLLDEPTTSLDIGHALAVLELCRDLADRGGHNVIIAMHELELARRYADRVLCLNGRGDATFGETSAIMSAATLADVFQVRVEAGEHGIAMFFASGELP